MFFSYLAFIKYRFINSASKFFFCKNESSLDLDDIPNPDSTGVNGIGCSVIIIFYYKKKYISNLVKEHSYTISIACNSYPNA